jgi:hypothetical protein
VLVVVITIGRMPVPVVRIVHVVLVRDGLVSAARAVGMNMAGMRQVRQRVLIVVAVMRCVGMTLVHVVDMSFALSAGVAAARPVPMRMLVNVMLVCHGSSLL